MQKLLPIFAALLLTLSACGEEEFKVPETREEQLAMLDEKEREVRKLRAQIAELQRAAGSDTLDLANARLVSVAPVNQGNFQREIELQATVESDELAVVTVELPGRITNVLVNEGDRVRKGQTLVRVDLEQVGLQIAELQTQLNLAKDLLERQQRLRDQNIGTEVQFLEAQNAVERIEKSLAQLRLQQGKSAVTSPISGTVENKNVNAGEYAAPGQPLMQILDASTVKVVAEVPEVYLKSVRVGQEVRVSFPAINENRKAKITEIGRTIDPANRTFEVELQLPNPQGVFKPNMLANIYLVDYQNTDVVVLESETILQEVDGREYVFVAEPLPGKQGQYVARKRYIRTGENDALRREVLSGIEPGDLVVRLGMRSLSENQPIRLEGQPTAIGLNDSSENSNTSGK